MSFIRAFLLAVVSLWIIDYASFERIGISISLVLFFFLAYKIFVGKPEYLLLYIFLFPQLPRGILDLFNGLSEARIQYNNLYSVDFISGLSLFWSLVIFTIIRYLNKNSIIDKSIVPFLVIGTISFFTGWFWFTGNVSYLISDIRFLVSIVFVASLNKDIIDRHHEYWDVLKLAIFIIALRVPMFLISDLVSGGISLDLAQAPFYSLSLIIDFVSRGRYLIFYLFSALSPSRAVMIWTVIMIFGLLLKSYAFQRVKYSFILAASSLMLLTIIYLTNPRLFDFILWKSNIFSALIGKSEFSGSGGVRSTEIIAVWREIQLSPFSFIFGKGLGSVYSLDIVDMSQNFGVIDLKSYSKQELNTGQFYSVHSVVAFLLLKFGLTGILGFLYLAIRSLRKGILFTMITLPILYSFYSLPFTLIVYLLVKKRWRREYH